MNALFQLVSEPEIEDVLPLMREFYSQQEMVFDESVARGALKKAIVNPQLGQAYLIFRRQELAGYFVLTFCFSLEFRGKFALLDELYIREPFRRQKFGRSAVEFAQRICRNAGIKAIRLEVWTGNQTAQSLYKAEGFKAEDRFLMTKWL
ncbi:MAG TPA: GNAT family N-acetyltransferase [Candidatus Angelobacter sp.]|jgi:ribosomal protein S18 acetylase RimI-like enzyme|nr:GNAT family N-acetyltransferase [Candidatus Angelobacter sp.]